MLIPNIATVYMSNVISGESCIVSLGTEHAISGNTSATVCDTSSLAPDC